MAVTKDLTRIVFGRLTAVCRSPRRNNLTQWECLCECGATIIVPTIRLMFGKTKSCGCLSKELSSERRSKHRMSLRGSVRPEYYTWSTMKARCYNEKNSNYPRYGGRGIKVSPLWLHDFAAFYADMGPRPQGLSLDRIDNNAGYEPGNCRWATAKEQSNNRG